MTLSATEPRWTASDGASSRSYALAFMGIALVLIAPLLVTLALKVNSLVGIDQAPGSLALVTGVGGAGGHGRQPAVRPAERPHDVLARDAAALDGRRSCWAARWACWSSRWRRTSRSCWLAGAWPSSSSTRCSPPWWRCCPDQVPVAQRGTVSGVLGVCLPVASVRRHLRRPAVYRPPARDVPGPVRHRRILRPAVRGHAGRPATGSRRPDQPGRCAGSSARSTSTPVGTRTSRWAFASRIAVHHRLRLPGDLPGVLPAGPDRHAPRTTSRARSSSPRSSSRSSWSSLSLIGGRLSDRTRPTQGLRHSRVDGLRAGPVRGRRSPATSTASSSGWR